MKNHYGAILTGSCIILFLLFPINGYSVNFSVNPIKVYFNSSNKTNVLEVKNNSEEKVTLNLVANEWSHDHEGNNIYSPTKDLIFFPKILTINKDEEKIIRIGSRLPSGSLEKTYRIFLEEVATPGQQDTTSVRMLMRVGVPVFISPLSTVSEGSIEKIELQKGNLEITVKNKGNIHLLMRSIKAKGADEFGKEVFNTERGGWYLHAGNSKNITMNIPVESCYKTKNLQITVDTDKLSMDKNIEIDKAMCTQ
jgi:fimbrial chaperone protein